tara:strand:+ start:160 stop:558 length:399 start_codon:yes stop_codon:yes gene_type:complete
MDKSPLAGEGLPCTLGFAAIEAIRSDFVALLNTVPFVSLHHVVVLLLLFQYALVNPLGTEVDEALLWRDALTRTGIADEHELREVGAAINAWTGTSKDRLRVELIAAVGLARPAVEAALGIGKAVEASGRIS